MDSALNISVKIAEHWELAHKFLGASYSETVDPYKAMLREAETKGVSLMTTALALCKAASESGHHTAIVWVSAAVYDVLAEDFEKDRRKAQEPSP